MGASDHTYIDLPNYYPYRNQLLRNSISIFSLILAATTVYLLWPSDPDLKIVQMELKRIHVHRAPQVTMDVSLSMTLKVQNADFYFMNYGVLEVGVGYRGKMLGHVTSEHGHVTSEHGHVMARDSSYIDVDLEFEGAEVFSDVLYFLEDLTKGTVPFYTVTELKGQLGLLFFQFPLQARLSCEVTVNTFNQTIANQNCYPEGDVEWHAKNQDEA